MLVRLQIHNYALIESLNLELDNGLTVITGETGSGKSIVLGAMGLILGDRSDTGVMRKPEQKTWAEAEFTTNQHSVNQWLLLNDIEVFDSIIIRRELLPGGRSRAFINDVPVQISQLKELSQFLVDIHLQQQQKLIDDKAFWYNLLDGFAGIIDQRESYQKEYKFLLQLQSELNNLKANADRINRERDYTASLLQELSAIDLSSDEKAIDSEQEMLEHADELKNALMVSTDTLQGDQGILSGLKHVIQILSRFQKVSSVDTTSQRLESIYIELKDIASELESTADTLHPDESRLQYLRDFSSHLIHLYRKHRTESIDELRIIKERLNKELFQADNMDEAIRELTEKICNTQLNCNQQAEVLFQQRVQSAVRLKKQIEELLSQLFIPDAEIQMILTKENVLNNFGIDGISILFTANKGMRPGPLSKTASGGERSRLMLAVKAISAMNINLPLLILDEIDTGVSGKVAIQMAHLMQKMATNMQLIAITHLPQIAAAGNTHIRVQKSTRNDETLTQIEILDEKGRIQELANILSGNTTGAAAEQNALELLSIFR
jgi:DNA repair protein RecN (Recombination protein N)